MSPADLSDEVKQTLDALRAQGLKLAIGSSSKNTPFILERIGLEPSICLVVEDAHAGVQAAKDGGFACAAMGDAKDDERADYHMSSFADLLQAVAD